MRLRSADFRFDSESVFARKIRCKILSFYLSREEKRVNPRNKHKEHTSVCSLQLFVEYNSLTSLPGAGTHVWGMFVRLLQLWAEENR